MSSRHEDPLPITSQSGIPSVIPLQVKAAERQHSVHQVSKQQTHMRYYKPKQTTMVLQPYHGQATTIYHSSHLLPWSHGPPWRRLLKGLVTAEVVPVLNFAMFKSQHDCDFQFEFQACRVVGARPKFNKRGVCISAGICSKHI